MNRRSIIIIIAVVVLVIGGVVIFRKKVIAPVKDDQKAEQQQNLSSDQNTTGDSLVGMLRESNDTSRGNLMLELTDPNRVVYILTSRDFSQLLDKEVIVTYGGTQDKFTLIDIQAIDSSQTDIKVN